VLIAGAYWGAFLLKHDFNWTRELKIWYVGNFPLVLLIQQGIFFISGVYRGVWRSLGVGDLIQLTAVVFSSVALSYSIAVISKPPDNSAYTFFCIDFLLLLIGATGIRCSHRILNYFKQREQASGDGALIYGAGVSGQLVVHELLQNTMLSLRPIGFIDDEPGLLYRTINRVAVLGAGDNLTSLLESTQVAVLIISSKKINGDRLQRVIKICQERNIRILRYSRHIEPIPWPYSFGELEAGYRFSRPS
jgi:UDP-GlcNAc:undecaprenyl-phosphate GlcNAc-1-phosphate transferase